MTDNMRPPFLRTLHVGDPHVLRSIPRLEEVHVQLIKKEFREVNLPVLPFLIERSGCSLREITLEDCIPGVNIEQIHFLASDIAEPRRSRAMFRRVER